MFFGGGTKHFKLLNNKLNKNDGYNISFVRRGVGFLLHGGQFRSIMLIKFGWRNEKLKLLLNSFVCRGAGIKKGEIMIRLYQDITPELLAEMLCQNIKAIGNTEYDSNAKQNLEEIAGLASWLIFKIKISADGYKDRQEASVIEFRETAKKCYDKLKAEFEEATDEVEFDD